MRLREDGEMRRVLFVFCTFVVLLSQLLPVISTSADSLCDVVIVEVFYFILA